MAARQKTLEALLTQLPGLRDLFYTPITTTAASTSESQQEESTPAEDANSLKLYRVVYLKTHRLLNP